MSISPTVHAPAIAVQIQRPLNPNSHAEFRSNVVTTGGISMIPEQRPQSFRDAVLAASQFAGSNKVAVGVFENAGRGADGSFQLSTLGTIGRDGTKPLNFEYSGVGDPNGGPVTDRFERTLYGAGATDAPALQAIVGAESFAAFGNGYNGRPTSLAALTEPQTIQLPSPDSAVQ